MQEMQICKLTKKMIKHVPDSEFYPQDFNLRPLLVYVSPVGHFCGALPSQDTNHILSLMSGWNRRRTKL